MAERFGRAFPQADILRPMRRQGDAGIGGASSVPSAPAQDVRFPDYYTPPEDAVTFTRTGWWDSPAAVGTNDPVALQLVLPENSVGMIRSFSQYVNDMVAGDDIAWSILIDDVPAENWGDVTMFPTIASFRTVNDDPAIHLPEGARIVIRLNNRSGLAKRIGASYSGWHWPNRGRVRK